MTLKTVPYSNQYVFGRGRLLLGLKDGSGISEGLRPVGNAPDFKINIKADLYQHTSSESGLAEVDYTAPKSITRTAQVTIDNITDRNLALFIAGALVAQMQTADPIANEMLPGIAVGAHYQLGKTAQNPTGVRKVASVTLKLPAGGAHQTEHAYAAGALVADAGKLYVASVAGLSGAAAPAFASNSVGEMTIDGTVTWAYVGASADVYTANQDYVLDAEHALVGILGTGKLAAIGAINATLPTRSAWVGLLANYTPSAGSRTQIKTGDVPQLSAEAKYISDNPTGANRDCYCADVTITPNGDLSLITADKNMSLTLDISINKLDSITPALIIDGETVVGS